MEDSLPKPTSDLNYNANVYLLICTQVTLKPTKSQLVIQHLNPQYPMIALGTQVWKFLELHVRDVIEKTESSRTFLDKKGRYFYEQ